LDLVNNENIFIDRIKNVHFAINDSNGKLYYTDESKNLIEMDLNSNAKKAAVENASIDYAGENGIIYTTIEPYDDPTGNGTLYNHWKGYFEYSTLQTHKLYIDDNDGSGTIDNFEYHDGFIIIKDNTIVYIDKTGNESVLLEENESKKIIGTPNNLTLLPNNKILITSYKELYEDGGTIYYSYILDLETKKVLLADIRSEYICEKICN
jgi:hypothetical protein